MAFLQMAGTLEQEVMVQRLFRELLMAMAVPEAPAAVLRFGVLLQVILGQVLVGLMVAQAKVTE